MKTSYSWCGFPLFIQFFIYSQSIHDNPMTALNVFFCIVQMSRLQHHLRFRLQLHLQFSLVEVVDICFVSTICRSYYVMKWPRKEWNRYLLASTASWVQELGGGVKIEKKNYKMVATNISSGLPYSQVCSIKGFFNFSESRTNIKPLKLKQLTCYCNKNIANG